MNIHEKYINRCIELAKNGIGATYPNPMVGSVIVLNDTIIGEGWHRKSGEPHAEVNAINAVKDKTQLKEATIYVNLEPCSHYGKTPPCANLIVEKGIKNIVIGSIDSNSKVSGKGVEHLENNGCNVIVGVLEKECKELNKRFFTFHNKKRPFIILKWAETKDGFIDKIRNKASENTPNWISNQYSQQLVHKMRAENEAVLVGTTTALNDNPNLNVRSWSGKNPVRVVIDRTLKIPLNYNLFKGSVKTILFTEIQKKNMADIFYEKIDFTSNVSQQICDVLYAHEIQSVIIEGGAKTLQSFIDKNLWDEAFVFIGEVVFKKGLKAPKLEKVPTEIKKISTDTLKVYNNK
ncbi:bifunctional diaminohydroxyphosphoribosylaminopyrimidine deaminase/5-amino-6-(5-phosphoribosylamino)uracil reductase RibD [Lutibacter sp.]|uniref:bifunctional diaminohydroxyphosphoribosylaminopyrimidine deaminase/5-amino-6-(5-phosphoribosylamino)uracil reductase RibD n=1 Tax=Lutibacter sp. TaxID=1925666 RepID=UPI0025C41DA4|nr:bifunctional diaminohydroxyphosphoribosylaminopyrimidine deaminase/5-amino-6-(5-phosphoribosylamino)uracil reductase RibD [Lutibacter sp.]MCF6167823.1 bifunctional diaminohydroxyphosphoribosylaminopyrimidine deaminase/5-amino-6-(5-phosphoribosylamino)uracil reductase RibD [Lutibacter sp.]